MTLLRTRRPSSTTATDVSSQLVSMPRVNAMVFFLDPRPDPPPYGGRGFLRIPLRDQVSAEASYVCFDPLQVCLVGAAEAGRVDAVRPHHDRVLTVVRVVTLAAPDDLEAESLVHLHRVLVGRTDLERDPLGAHFVGGLDQPG